MSSTAYRRCSSPAPTPGIIGTIDRCDQCDFDYDSLERADVPRVLASIGDEFRRALSARAMHEALRRRPRPEVWSALEYACHVRDVFLWQRDRLYLALVEDRPRFVRMYRDERAVLAHYNQQDPQVVANQVVVAAQLIAQAFADLEGGAWERRFVYNWPTPQERNVAWLGVHTVHEGRHHLQDFRAVAEGSAPGVA
jgi:hypothetical protein